MEKRFQIIDEKTLECSVLVVLTPTETAIMESADLRKQIDAIAKDLHVRWAVETNGNITQACISKLFSPISTSNDAHQLEIIATNFMSAINKLTLPVFKEDCPTHEPANEEAEVLAEEIAFVKELKEDADTLRGALIIPRGIPTAFAVVADACHVASHACLIRMIDAYLEKYSYEPPKKVRG